MQKWFLIVLAILIVILVLILLAALKRGRNDKRLGKVNDSFEQMTNRPIYKTIDQLEDLALSGSSQASLEQWHQQYYHLLNDVYAALYQNMFDADAANQKFAVISASKKIQTAEEQLESAQVATDEVATALAQLLNSDEQNQALTKDLLASYRKIRKLLLTKSFEFGPAVDQLENHLADFDTRFDQIKALSKQGDHLKAEEELKDAQDRLQVIQDQMKRIPPRYTELATEFPDQLKEIDSVYQEMTADHYCFPEPNIGDTLIILRQRLQQINEQLAQLQIGTVEERNQEVSQQIDELYQRLEDELKARQQVAPLQKTTLEFLNHASAQTTKLIDSLNHLNQSYVLMHHELEDAQAMQAAIQKMQRQYDAQVLAIAEKKVIATKAVALFKETNQRLTEIEQQQFKISNDVSSLFEGEKVAKQGVRQFVLDLKSIQREIEHLRLPGLPQDYLDYFNMVKEEITKLENNLNQVQINIEDITKQLIMTQEDLNNLAQKSKDLRDAAILTEQALQYANRYTYANPTLADAATQARDAYGQEFAYKKALDTIATALEQIEPGSFKRIEQTYYAAEPSES
ncbi:septation ring formation regulator EzrA [Lapidilactobacillus luobeiensis]|uniref:septation ring formation regulator EzrA n=1 Tax=Lapidilactobacillus luobeiensis TaxID=2950371 RepID=UPI0021C4761E|nr:septation ring formation regulator EzrA [Lapidilactobacillus luobeiensis]